MAGFSVAILKGIRQIMVMKVDLAPTLEKFVSRKIKTGT
jgi:hypothetical protein